MDEITITLSVIFMVKKKAESDILDYKLFISEYDSTSSFDLLEDYNLEPHKCKINEMINMFEQLFWRLVWNAIQNK